MVVGMPIHEITGVVFFTPGNTETRIAFVDNLIAYHFSSESAVVAEWKNIKGKLDRLKNTRNGIVHGMIGVE